jgi:undecaprenyl-diphosphatase
MPILTDIFKAILLGVVEGLTEFLPVSSTAHLILTSQIVKFDNIQNSVFEITIQLGAILAICFLYRSKIYDVIFKINEKKQQKFSLNIILAFLPAAIIGLSFHKEIKDFFFSNLTIAISLILGGIIMIIAEKINLKKEIDDIDKITYKKSLAIGFCQALAMIPGVSRSGSTIIGGLFLGLNRKIAAEFSFFLAIPTIGAATIYDLYKNFENLNFNDLTLISIGLITSFISSIFIIKWFINFISKNSFVIFGIYRILLGLIIFLFFI